LNDAGVTVGTVHAMPAKRCLQYPTGNDGFTLLELMVVCLLIGLLLSLSIPSLRNSFFSDPLKSAARNLIGLTNGVRQLAIRSQQPYFLHIDETEKRIWIERELKIEKEGQKKEKLVEKGLRLPETVSVSGVWVGDEKQTRDQTALWISKQGIMERTRIGLEDDKGNRLAVQLFPFLDAATVIEDRR
jgi:prepilin-type N-terminal cleavage/methylation domain-containing protein